MSGDHHRNREAPTLDTTAVAARLGLAPHLVRFLVTHRCIPHAADGDRVRFHPSVIDAWAALCGLPAPAAVSGNRPDQNREDRHGSRDHASRDPDNWDGSRDHDGQDRDESRDGRGQSRDHDGRDWDESRDRDGQDRDQGRGRRGGGLARVYRLDDYRNRRRRP